MKKVLMFFLMGFMSLVLANQNYAVQTCPYDLWEYDLELSIDISTARDGYFTVTVVPANDKINWHLTAGATDGSASFSHDGYGTQSFEVNSNGTYPGKTFIASVWNYEVNASVEETWWQ